MLKLVQFTFFFFFQAEDGIRDADVTGVQTCALPIWIRDELSPRVAVSLMAQYYPTNVAGTNQRYVLLSRRKIGRASCRERVENSVVVASLKKKRKDHDGCVASSLIVHTTV